MKNAYDIVIAGGGASGLVSAITAKRSAPAADILIIEKNKILGKKIQATGNGRCNLSNVRCPGKDEVLSFFETIGIITRTDGEGRIYPYTEDAKDVRGALSDEVKRLGIDVLTSSSVTDASFDGDAGEYVIKISGEEELSVKAPVFLIAMGGKAAPKFGTTGDGYKIAKKLYHSVTKLAPALTKIETKEDVSGLSGIREKARVSLIAGGGTLFEEEGEVQFADYGITGICVFDMTRYMQIPEGRTLINGLDDYAVEIDFLPGIPEDGARKMIAGGMRLVKKALRDLIAEKTGGDPEMTLWQLKHFTLHPDKLKGWDHAEITKGGVPLSELDMSTMASRFMPGLFFSGEVIDFDGPSGGFNLENAWETGMRAGRAMAKAVGPTAHGKDQGNDDTEKQ